VTKIHKTAIVPYSAEQMYVLVNDIETYPQFLPWCKSASILSQNGTHIVASIAMGISGLEKSFTTNNVLEPNNSIEMRLLEGPFSHLHGFWKFQQLGHDGCKISFDMQFEITNKLLKMTLGPVFSKIVNSLVDAFVKRANELYGKSKSYPR
jgi:ribosome-associated toxin RatA of RatAB toxin-antitoxin module